MAKKVTRKGFYKFQYDINKVGKKPGSVVSPQDSFVTTINVFAFNQEVYEQKTFETFNESLDFAEKDNTFYWIAINGLKTQSIFDEIVLYPGITPLEVEDVLNNYQRPKIEAQLGHVFFQCRLLVWENDELTNQQLSLFIFKNKIVTVTENEAIEFKPLVKRLASDGTMLRQNDAAFLGYSILDSIVDHYFVLISHLSEKLDTIEDQLIQNPNIEARNELIHIKRSLLQVRKAVWPLRDAVNELIREKYKPFSNENLPYLRDLYDHCIHLIDLIENYREISSSLMDIYMSGVSNRMNEIMKVLTILSAFFIPLSFISGLYGMNFANKTANGDPAPFNMPELYQSWGYPAIILLMATISTVQAVIFWKKGWFKKG